jgi:hypothetical protein
MTPPAWYRDNEIEAAIFWNRRRRPALYLVSEGAKWNHGAASNHGQKYGPKTEYNRPAVLQSPAVNGGT